MRGGDGLLATSRDNMIPIVENYFQNIFLTTNLQAINQVVQNVEAKVTPYMNASLLNPFSSEEVRFALFQMHPTKAPGPDSMNALFY